MLFSRKELAALAHPPAIPVVSLYLPTETTGDTEQNRIRLKNLLRASEEKLQEHGLRAPEAKNILAPAENLLDNLEFWQHQSDGLAVFLGPGFFRYYRVPLAFRESARTGKRSHIRPLLPLLHGDGMFYVLALSQNQTRFLQCSKERQRSMRPEGVPESLAEALKYDQPQKQQQMHTMGAGTGLPAVFHGQGAAKDYDKDAILRYCQQVVNGLHPVLKDEKAPLVLAAVEYIQSIFREASDYRDLVEPGVTGNPEIMSDAELRSQTWPLIEPIFTRAKDRAFNDYYEAATHGKGLGDVRDAVAAAYDGRVSVLFAAEDLVQWGRFDESRHEAELTGEDAPGAEDLVELASVMTLEQDGEVYAAPPEAIPGGTPVAGILRY